MSKYIKTRIILFLLPLCLCFSGCFQKEDTFKRLPVPPQLNNSEIVIYAKVKNLIFFGLMDSGGVVFSLHETVKDTFADTKRELDYFIKHVSLPLKTLDSPL